VWRQKEIFKEMRWSCSCFSEIPIEETGILRELEIETETDLGTEIEIVTETEDTEKININLAGKYYAIQDKSTTIKGNITVSEEHPL
jgi:hypothetical protein